MNMCKKLRTLFKEKDYLFTPGIANPVQAMIVEKAGFDYVYMGGYDTSVTRDRTPRAPPSTCPIVTSPIFTSA